jgi:hypothetical protein
MVVSLFAMPPPDVLLSWPIGYLFIILLAGLFVTATRTRGKRSEQNRRVGLALMAILCGPLVGATVAWLGITLGDVVPADVRDIYVVLIFIGCIAGSLAAVAFGLTGLLGPRDSGRKTVTVKRVDLMDEL